jgi:hypothetical protein
MSADGKDTKSEEKGSADGPRAEDERKLPEEKSNANESGQRSTRRYPSIGLGMPSSIAHPEGDGSSERDESKPKREFLAYSRSFQVLMTIYRCKHRHVRGHAIYSHVRPMLTTIVDSATGGRLV